MVLGDGLKDINGEFGHYATTKLQAHEWYLRRSKETSLPEIQSYLKALNPAAQKTIERIGNHDFLGAITLFHEMEEVHVIKQLLGVEQFNRALQSRDSWNMLHEYFEVEKGKYRTKYYYAHERATYTEMEFLQLVFKDFFGSVFSLASILATHPRWASEGLSVNINNIPPEMRLNEYAREIAHLQLADYEEEFAVPRDLLTSEVLALVGCWQKLGARFSDDYLRMTGGAPDTITV